MKAPQADSEKTHTAEFKYYLPGWLASLFLMHSNLAELSDFCSFRVSICLSNTYQTKVDTFINFVVQIRHVPCLGQPILKFYEKRAESSDQSTQKVRQHSALTLSAGRQNGVDRDWSSWLAPRMSAPDRSLTESDFTRQYTVKP